MNQIKYEYYSYQKDLEKIKIISKNTYKYKRMFV